MPGPQVKKSALSSKYGASLDNIIAQHGQETTMPTMGFKELPPNIPNGIAQLDSIEFINVKTGDHQGQPALQARAVAMEPASVPDEFGRPVKVAGEQFTPFFMIVIAEGVKDFDGNPVSRDAQIQKAMERLRGFAGPDATSRCRTTADLDRLCAELSEAKPFFRFSTRPKTKDARDPNTGKTIKVPAGTTVLCGTCEGLQEYVPPNGMQAVQDDTSPQGTMGGGGMQITEAMINALFERCGLDPSDEAAENELKSIASQVSGRSVEEVDALPSWDDIFDVAKGGVWPSDGPAIGDPKMYTPVVRGKKTRKAEECEIIAVNADGTVNLRQLKDGKTEYKNVPVSELTDPM